MMHVIRAIPKDLTIELRFFSGLKYSMPDHNSSKLAGQKPKAYKHIKYRNNIIA